MQKTVLITGASCGIGRAAAKKFAGEGYRVVLNYHRSGEAAHRLESELQKAGSAVLALQADVADPAQVEAMFRRAGEAFGLIDTLVCNAGIAEQKLFTDITEEDWARMMNINVSGAFRCCKAALPGMIQEKRGKIVLVSSIWGIAGASCEVHYSASKAALIGMTKALAKEVGPSGICVNCVAPGVTATKMNEGLSEETLLALREETPLGRIGTPAEIAEAIFFLASEKADFITGQVLSPNGGFVI